MGKRLVFWVVAAAVVYRLALLGMIGATAFVTAREIEFRATRGVEKIMANLEAATRWGRR